MRGAREPLCCCEYFNEHGDRSHILTCCCDCQAFDEIFERLITCRSFDTTLTDRVKATMWDRCRFPYPGGAKTINWSLVGAILLPPICLICSSFHFLVNAASLTAFISLFFFLSQSQSELHFSFVISFLVTQVLIYASEIQPSLDIQYYENIVIYSTLIASGVCLFGAKYSKCPGGKQTPIYYLSW